MSIKHCNKCNSELYYYNLKISHEEYYISIFTCIKKDCEYFGLMQVPKEDMDKFLNEKY